MVNDPYGLLRRVAILSFLVLVIVGAVAAGVWWLTR
jgi:hypothetical protein